MANGRNWQIAQLLEALRAVQTAETAAAAVGDDERTPEWATLLKAEEAFEHALDSVIEHKAERVAKDAIERHEVDEHDRVRD